MKDRSHKKPAHKRRPPMTPKLPRPLRDASGPIRREPEAGGEPSAPTHWGGVADWYDELVGEEGSEYHREVVIPGALRLLGAKPNEHVLDIACGQGVLCRALSRQGILATGIDAAPELIRLAKDRNEQMKKSTAGGRQMGVEEGSGFGDQRSEASQSAISTLPTYSIADARDLSFLRDDEFAAAACLLAIQNLNPIGSVFSSVARVLKSMGRFVIVMMHPCFRSPKESGWGWDEKMKVQYRRVDRYLLPRKVPIVTHPGKGRDYTWTFHKPIEAYVKASRRAGLLIDALEEWPSHKTSTSGPRAPAENVARNEIPMFLALRAVKVAGYVGQAETGSEDAAGE